MAQCTRCGKKGWFLILFNGFCSICLDEARSKAMEGKIFIINNLTGRYNSNQDSYKVEAINEFVRKIQEKIVPTSIADRLDNAQVIITLSDDFNFVGYYSDGSIAGRLDIKLNIKDNEGNLLFRETFVGQSPADKIYKMSNERAKSVTGLLPTVGVLNYMDFLLRKYRHHKDVH